MADMILLVGRDSRGSEAIGRVLDDPAGSYRLQSIKHFPTALARLGGGSVDLILVDLSGSQAEGGGLEGFLQLHAAAAETPTIVLYDPAGQSLAEQAVQAGAVESLSNAACETDLRRIVGLALERRRAAIAPVFRAQTDSRRSGKVIVCMGSKGGAGTTTVGLNIATALARDSNVILAELHPTPGSLAQYCRPLRVARDLGHLLKMNPGAIGRAEVEASLWSYKSVPRLRILFGPQSMEGGAEAGRHHAKAISVALTALADYVVVDLSVSLSEANRTIIQDADCLALVVERDPISVQLAKLILAGMEDWDTTPLTGAVIVNRAGLVSPMDIADLEIRLSVPIFGSIPPAPDQCAFAQNAHTPLLVFDPDGLAAASLNSVAEELKRRMPVTLPAESASLPQAVARAF